VQVVNRAGVTAWTRPRKHANGSGKTMAVRALPNHLTRQLAQLPTGVYDGELMGGDTSTDVTRTDLQDSLVYVVFDVLRIGHANVQTMSEPYERRRCILEQSVFIGPAANLSHVKLAPSRQVTDQQFVADFVEMVWRRGGEGAILKRKKAIYQAGKRSPDFVKVKKLQTTVCTVVGFEATRGQVLNRGAFATVLLQDEHGNKTSVKTKDDAEIAAFERAWDQRSSVTTHTDTPNKNHPALGRKLRIEFQDFTPEGGYRHPRWDRWEDE